MSTYFKPCEIAKILRVSTQTVLRLIDAGELPSVIVGKQRRVEAVEFDRYLARHNTLSLRDSV